MSVNTCIESHLFLFKNRLFVPKLFTIAGNLRLRALFINKRLLVCNPGFLCLSNLIVDFRDLFLNALLDVFEWPCVLFSVAVLFSRISKLSV